MVTRGYYFADWIKHTTCALIKKNRRYLINTHDAFIRCTQSQKIGKSNYLKGIWQIKAQGSKQDGWNRLLLPMPERDFEVLAIRIARLFMILVFNTCIPLGRNFGVFTKFLFMLFFHVHLQYIPNALEKYGYTKGVSRIGKSKTAQW